MTEARSKQLPTSLGGLLRQWRNLADVSQLELALELNISSRHLSFLETGRARPSEGMLAAFADAVQIPDSERNTLRLMAGFAPRRASNPQATLRCGAARETIEQVKRAHHNVPLLVKDRIWDIVDVNDDARNLFASIMGHSSLARLENTNVLELIFAPGLLREVLENWEEVADATVLRVQREIGLAHRDPAFQVVICNAASLPGFTTRWERPVERNGDQLSTRYIFRTPAGLRAYDSVLMSLGSPYETLLNGIRFDTFHLVEDC